MLSCKLIDLSLEGSGEKTELKCFQRSALLTAIAAYLAGASRTPTTASALTLQTLATIK